jgi:hypothetical protein
VSLAHRPGYTPLRGNRKCRGKECPRPRRADHSGAFRPDQRPFHGADHRLSMVHISTGWLSRTVPRIQRGGGAFRRHPARLGA